MRTLYLHVGPAKTGTSAIQHALRGHDDSVVIYPKVGLWPDGSHHNLVLNFFEDYRRPDMVRNSADVLLKEIGQILAASTLNVVISSEMLPEQPDIGRFIEAITGLFGGESISVEIVVVCREHFERAASTYNQLVKDPVSRERAAPDIYLRRKCAELGYANLIERLRRTGALVTAINYHPAPSLVERFLRHVGFLQVSVPRAELRNVSLSPKALIATLAANNVAVSMDSRQRYFAALRKMRRFFAPSVFIFGTEAALEADEYFESDRRYLAAEFGIDFPTKDIFARAAGLSLDEREMDQIRAATGELGAEGQAIVDFAARFKRS